MCNNYIGVQKAAIPAKVADTNYYAVVDEDNCTGCGSCADICQMGAVAVEDGLSVVNQARCSRCQRRSESDKACSTHRRYLKIPWFSVLSLEV